MSDLTLKPDPDQLQAGDKRLAVPMLSPRDGGCGVSRRVAGRARRRFSATRLAAPIDDGFHLFRVY